MIVLGLSGLPNSQRRLHETNPDIDPLDARIAQGLDSAAAIIVDGALVAAASEERFDGDKGTGALPRQAIAWCLAEAGVAPEDVDVVAHGFDYDRHKRAFVLSRQYFDEVLSSQTVRDALTDAGWPTLAEKLRSVEHHRAHALSAVVPSGYDSGLAVVSDGMGEIDSVSVYRFSRGERSDGTGPATELEKLHSQPIASSLGILYSIGTRFLGFQFNNDEYKVMGLAPYGDPERYREVFRKLTRFDHDKGSVVIDWPKGALSDPEGGYPQARALLEEQTFTPSPPDGSIQRDEADFAASMQECLTDLLVSLVGHWLEKTGETSLCLAGGTFLNCKSNQSIADLPGLERLFVQPASGDDGTSLGAAYAVAEDLLPVRTPFDPYLGARYSADEVRAVLEARPDLQWRELGMTDEYLAAAAEDIAADRIIAVFHGRMEFGPRALGNRSIVARPDGDRIKDRINSAVKFREAFRPFAPAVHVDDRDRLFVTRGFDPDHYMLSTADVRPEAKPMLSGIVHEDDSARIQTVTQDLNPTFATLLEQVRARTGVGCVVNTSFNVKGQPLIMDPETAVDTFSRIALDRLYIEGFVVEGTPS